MKKINFKVLIITCIVCLLPIILGLVFYNELPDSVAIHFDMYGNPDNYFPKLLFILAVPVFMTFMQAFCCIASDMSDKNPEANKKAVGVYKWLLPTITILLYVVTLMYALGSVIDIRKVVMIILGLMFITIGNYIPKTVGSVGWHFPKFEIQNEELERKTKKITGYGLMIDGVFCIISILFVPQVSVALVLLFILECLALTAYTLIKSKKNK